ncbi:MAG: AraC family transcriptional regulator, partial [Lentisphaeraceae bacterium]|nr:AraC family transcriptional regulator [Lentisphaeraceae bacterium]
LLKNDVEDVMRNKNQDLTKQITELIHENVSLPLQLEDIARHFDHSSRHLNRIFTSVEGLSIGKYILKHKMTMASQALVKDDRPIKTIAYEFGFNEPSYFCRIFKKTFGMSPQVYRAKNSRI